MRTAVLLITFFVLLLTEGSCLAVTRDLELSGRDSKILEVFLGCARPFLTQHEVVGKGPPFIAMTFDERRLTAIGTKPAGIAIEDRHGVLVDLETIIFKEHVTQRITAWR